MNTPLKSSHLSTQFEVEEKAGKLDDVILAFQVDDCQISSSCLRLVWPFPFPFVSEIIRIASSPFTFSATTTVRWLCSCVRLEHNWLGKYTRE
jgi:hypothetical protein